MAEFFVGRVEILLEGFEKSFRRVPVLKGTAQVLGAAQIAEPNSALGLYLLEIGAAIRRKHERHIVLMAVGVAPRCALHQFLFTLDYVIAGIPLGLVDGSRNIFPLSFCLNDRDRLEARKQNIVRRSAGRWPFGDGDVLSFLRTNAVAETESRRVGFPTGGPQLGID